MSIWERVRFVRGELSRTVDVDDTASNNSDPFVSHQNRLSGTRRLQTQEANENTTILYVQGFVAKCSELSDDALFGVALCELLEQSPNLMRIR
jgi:hypothetical protein